MGHKAPTLDKGFRGMVADQLTRLRTSGFGVRIGRLARRPGHHLGVDFAGPMYTPVYAPAAGVISVFGQRGNVVEIDDGRELKTRFGHLAAIYLAVGRRVALGTKLGGIGSTGRSTGPHLHHEVWVDGRLQNPERFLEAGQYVQQATE
jgi:murein DD-endopeptidase MepM/ murein hydrolase activator NlpD